MDSQEYIKRISELLIGFKRYMTEIDDKDENYKVCNLLQGVTAKNRQPLLDYLRKYGPKQFIEKASFRTEEPLKGYRQWVFDALCEGYKRNLDERKS